MSSVLSALERGLSRLRVTNVCTHAVGSLVDNGVEAYRVITYGFRELRRTGDYRVTVTIVLYLDRCGFGIATMQVEALRHVENDRCRFRLVFGRRLGVGEPIVDRVIRGRERYADVIFIVIDERYAVLGSRRGFVGVFEIVAVKLCVETCLRCDQKMTVVRLARRNVDLREACDRLSGQITRCVARRICVGPGQNRRVGSVRTDGHRR